MDIKRYVITQAVKTRENELIPIWDNNIVFDTSELYGNVITLKNKRSYEHFSLVECIYDLKTKQVEMGVELNYYPNENELEFKIGEVVLFEKSNRVLAEAKISEVVYEDYDLNIERGRKLCKYTTDRFKGVKFDVNTLYAIKDWKPFYVLDNGIKIEWSHQLYHKF